MARAGTSWKAGQSGNPKGRPPVDRALSDLLRKLLAKRGEDGRTNREAVAAELIELARGGSVPALALLFDRVEGRVTEKHELSGAAGEPLIFTLLLNDHGEEGEGDDD